MLEIAKLQFRKNRLIFVGMALTIAGSIPFAGMIAVINGHPLYYGVDSALYFWSFLGLPMIAVLLGSSSGAANATDPFLSAEELLPVSGVRSAFASIGASIGNMGGLALLFLILAFIVSEQWRESLVMTVPDASSWLRAIEAPIVRPLFWLSVLTLPLFVVSSFCAAYGTRNGIVGGFLGLAASGTMVLSLAGGWALHLFYAYRAPFVGKTVMILLLAVAATAWAVVDVVRWLGRGENRSWKRIVIPVAALGFGATASLLSLTTAWARVNRGVVFVKVNQPGWFQGNQGAHVDMASAAAREKAMKGALIKTLDGGVYMFHAKGERRMMAPATGRPILTAISEGPQRGVIGAAWHADGGLWVVRGMPGLEGKGTDFQFWHAKSGGDLKFSSPARGSYWRPIVSLGDRLGTITWGSDSRRFHEVGGGKIDVETMGVDETIFVQNEWIKQRNAGRLSKDGTRFSATLPDGRKMTWVLPGKAASPLRSNGVRFAVRASGKSFYAISVDHPEGGPDLAVLEFDGSVRTVWRGAVAWPPEKSTPRGGLYSLAHGNLYAMTAEGEFLTKTNLQSVYKRVAKAEIKRGEAFRVLRVNSDRAHVLIFPGHLATIQIGTGKILSEVELPESPLMADMLLEYENRPVHQVDDAAWNIVEDGFFWHTGNYLYFVDWKGKISDFGKA